MMESTSYQMLKASKLLLEDLLQKEADRAAQLQEDLRIEVATSESLADLVEQKNDEIKGWKKDAEIYREIGIINYTKAQNLEAELNELKGVLKEQPTLDKVEDVKKAIKVRLHMLDMYADYGYITDLGNGKRYAYQEILNDLE